MALKQLKTAPVLVKASLNDYPTIQNMARFYVYDMSRSCGFISKDWACPADGLYESFDFKNYFEDPSREAFLVTVKDELAGFVLLNQIGTLQETEWNVGEFFILGKFQGQGIGQWVAHEIWKIHPGHWEVSVIPENKSALMFWRQAISTFTQNHYQEEEKNSRNGTPQPKRIIIHFNTHQRTLNPPVEETCPVKITVVDDLTEQLEQHMTNDLIAYETSHGIDVNYKRFSLVLSNHKNEPCGVINAFTAFAEIYIDDIWVDSAYRGKGYGQKLLQAVEELFKGQGFNNINLCTSAFQAPEFYKKCGFRAEFTRINKKNPKLSKTFFVKFFEEENQTQGIIKKD